MRLRIGVSSCLLGEPVRYDGGDRRAAWVADALARDAELVPVCPEVELGLGVPRPTIEIRSSSRGPRLVMPERGLDLTEAMSEFARERALGLLAATLHGFLLKARSPSCGIRDVALDGVPHPEGEGFFAAALRRADPVLPVEDEDGLADAARRDAFLLRAFARRRLLGMLREGSPLGEFHRRHRDLLARLSGEGERRLESLAREERRDAYGRAYQSLLAEACARGSRIEYLEGHEIGAIDADEARLRGLDRAGETDADRRRGRGHH